MYDNGQGVTQDYQKAFKWVSLPAEKGDVQAQFFLACMYRSFKYFRELLSLNKFKLCPMSIHF
jgi:TPR repeat protein